MLPSPTYETIIHRVIPDVEFHQNRYARALDEALRPGNRWLDVGAGTRLHGGWIGSSCEELASRCRAVVGCDLDRSHLQRNPSLSHRACGDGGALPFRDGAFDVVSANMVLEHLPRPAEVFREIGRVLVPGGRFVFVTPNLNHPAVRLASILLPPRLRRIATNRLERRPLEHVLLTYYRANTRGAVRSLAAEAGLEPRTIEIFSGYPIIPRPWPAVTLEAAWIRFQNRTRFLEPLGSNLVGVLRRPPARVPLGSRRHIRRRKPRV